MKRFALTVGGFVVAALVLSPSLFALAPDPLSALPALDTTCGEATAATVKMADLPLFFASPRLAATCTFICPQEHTMCRQQCNEPSCSLGYFSCSPANPCGAVCECFCL